MTRRPESAHLEGAPQMTRRPESAHLEGAPQMTRRPESARRRIHGHTVDEQAPQELLQGAQRAPGWHIEGAPQLHGRPVNACVALRVHRVYEQAPCECPYGAERGPAAIVAMAPEWVLRVPSGHANEAKASVWALWVPCLSPSTHCSGQRAARGSAQSLVNRGRPWELETLEQAAGSKTTVQRQQVPNGGWRQV